MTGSLFEQVPRLPSLKFTHIYPLTNLFAVFGKYSTEIKHLPFFHVLQQIFNSKTPPLPILKNNLVFL